jgi:hypothetical protein
MLIGGEVSYPVTQSCCDNDARLDIPETSAFDPASRQSKRVEGEVADDSSVEQISAQKISYGLAGISSIAGA